MENLTRSNPEPELAPRVRLFPDYVAFREQSVNCRCGWRGAGRLAEPGRLFDMGVEVKCPCCTARLGVAIFAPLARELPIARRFARAGATAQEAAQGTANGGEYSPRTRIAALASLLSLYGSMTPAEHVRAHALLGSDLELTRENWIASFFDGYRSDTLPTALEGHLPLAFARELSGVDGVGESGG